MIVTNRRTVVTALAIATVVGCRAPYNTRQGAVLGGLTGAGLGAVVGGAHGKPRAGAAIGSAVGATTGAMVGSGVDQAEARHRAEVISVEAEAMANSVSMADVVEMSAAGLSDDVIVSHLEDRGFREPLGPGDLIALKQEGVTDSVIKAAQSISTRPIRRTGSVAPVVFGPSQPIAGRESSTGVPVASENWGTAFDG